MMSFAMCMILNIIIDNAFDIIYTIITISQWYDIIPQAMISECVQYQV